MAANPQQADNGESLDKDNQETREWMDALSAVIESEGPERAHFLLEQLLEHARQKSIDMPFSANTGYVNSIEADKEERSPGNLEIEGRLRAYMRWNAMAMVVKANTPKVKITAAIVFIFRVTCLRAFMRGLTLKAG